MNKKISGERNEYWYYNDDGKIGIIYEDDFLYIDSIYL
jgi:hypothetical protein